MLIRTFFPLSFPEYQVRSIASHVRPDRQSKYKHISDKTPAWWAASLESGAELGFLVLDSATQRGFRKSPLVFIFSVGCWEGARVKRGCLTTPFSSL